MMFNCLATFQNYLCQVLPDLCNFPSYSSKLRTATYNVRNVETQSLKHHRAFTYWYRGLVNTRKMIS